MQSIPEAALIKATDLVQNFEGFSSYPYADPGTGGMPYTYGFGSTLDFDEKPVTLLTAPISRLQGLALLKRDIKVALSAIVIHVTVPLSINQWAALGSFIYNVGEYNFKNSTLLILLNEKNYLGAALQFKRWDEAGGRIVSGLKNRRIAEMNLFNTLDEETNI